MLEPHLVARGQVRERAERLLRGEGQEPQRQLVRHRHLRQHRRGDPDCGRVVEDGEDLDEHARASERSVEAPVGMVLEAAVARVKVLVHAARRQRDVVLGVAQARGRASAAAEGRGPPR